jgi:addiction module HigA family antidote
MVRIPTHGPPTHPGEMLLEEFLIPMGLTQRELADGIRVPYQRVNELVNGRRGITPATALFARGVAGRAAQCNGTCSATVVRTMGTSTVPARLESRGGAGCAAPDRVGNPPTNAES